MRKANPIVETSAEIRRFEPNELADAHAYFRAEGFVVFRNAFALEVAERFWNALESGIAGGMPLTFSQYGNLYTNPEVPEGVRGLPRIIDVEDHLEIAHQLMLCETVRAFLEEAYGAPPTCLQTLTYKYSSEQGAHSDKTLVSPPCAPNYDRETLTAAWFALQPSNRANGALVVYPGSHRVPKRGFTEGFSDYGVYTAYLEELCITHGCLPTVFTANAGDLLFWASDFVHAGGAIEAEGPELPTRRSLVCHYARLPGWQPSLDKRYIRQPLADASFFRKARLATL